MCVCEREREAVGQEADVESEGINASGAITRESGSPDHNHLGGYPLNRESLS